MEIPLNSIKVSERSFIVPATIEMVNEMIPRIREADKREAEALGFEEAGDALHLAFRRSWMARAWIIDGKVGCMFGVCVHMLYDEASSPWFVSTDEVAKNRVHFLRHCRPFLKDMFVAHNRLEDFVDARYTQCIRWLRWLGFIVHEAEPHGPYGALFHRFEIRI